MNKKTNKKLKLILTIVICSLITIGVTIGIGCYNYYGYQEYKKDYLHNYFDTYKENNISNQEKIERSVKWDNSQYIKHPGSVTYYDPGKLINNKDLELIDHSDKNLITNTPLNSPSSMHNGAYFENGVLHLPEMFDLEIYQTRYTEVENNFDKLSYNIYISNIQEYTLHDKIRDLYQIKTMYNKDGSIIVSDDIEVIFENIYISFVPGTNSESLANFEKLTNAIEGGKETMNDFELGVVFDTWNYSITKTTIGDDGKEKINTLASFALYDNVIEDVASNNSLIRYTALKKSDTVKGTIDAKNAEDCDGFCFVVYYYELAKDVSNGEVGYSGDGVVLLEGIFDAEKVNNETIKASTFDLSDKKVDGYSKNYYQSSYNSFIKNKMILTCTITFLVSAVITGLIGFIWSIDLKQVEDKKRK